MELLVTIGLDRELVERVRARLEARVVAYPSVPVLYSLDGQVRVESATVSGRWLEPAGVVFFGYFDDAGAARRALALGATPTFPEVGATLPLDERAMALVLALRAEGAPRVEGSYRAGSRSPWRGSTSSSGATATAAMTRSASSGPWSLRTMPSWSPSS